MVAKKEGHQSRHEKKEIRPYLSESIRHLIVYMQYAECLGQQYAAYDHQQEVKRPYAQHPFNIEVADADGAGLIVLSEQQVGDQEAAQYKEEGNGIIPVPEQPQPFQVIQAILLSDCFSMVHNHQESGKEPQRIKPREE